MSEIQKIESNVAVLVEERGTDYEGLTMIVEPEKFDKLIHNLNSHGGSDRWDITKLYDITETQYERAWINCPEYRDVLDGKD